MSTMDGPDLVGPGEDDNERLVLNIRVLKGETMKIETGDVDEIVFLELTSRSLGSVDEQQVHRFGMSREQALFTCMQLYERAGGLPE